MAIAFKRATKASAKLRLALMGPAGAGKTYSALRIAHHLVPGGRIAVIDTERGSASKYADLCEFDVLELETFSPATYVDAIHAAEAEGYDVIVVDSLSHAWMGKDGALEQVDRIAARSQARNTFSAWRDVTPQHNTLVEAMIGCRTHLIVTMRSKTEYVLEEDARGKKVPRKIGLAPVQRDGLEYEFDVVGEISVDNNGLAISKTRCPELTGGYFQRPGREVAAILREWLGGEPAAQPPAAPPPPAKARQEGAPPAPAAAPSQPRAVAQPPRAPAAEPAPKRAQAPEVPRSQPATAPNDELPPEAYADDAHDAGDYASPETWAEPAATSPPPAVEAMAPWEAALAIVDAPDTIALSATERDARRAKALGQACALAPSARVLEHIARVIQGARLPREHLESLRAAHRQRKTELLQVAA